jgi:hypothetical protein
MHLHKTICQLIILANMSTSLFVIAETGHKIQMIMFQLQMTAEMLRGKASQGCLSNCVSKGH